MSKRTSVGNRSKTLSESSLGSLDRALLPPGLGAVGIVACLLLWQLGSSTGVFDPLSVSSPPEVLPTAVRLLPSPAFVAIVLLALFGIGLVSLVTHIENRFCNW